MRQASRRSVLDGVGAAEPEQPQDRQNEHGHPMVTQYRIFITLISKPSPVAMITMSPAARRALSVASGSIAPLPEVAE